MATVGFIIFFVCLLLLLVIRNKKSPSTTDEIKTLDAKAYFNRGGIKSERKDYGGALQDYNKAIEINSKNAAHTTEGD